MDLFILVKRILEEVEQENELQQELLNSLVDLGFDSGRMKTGTPPRVDGRSLDYSKMIEQPGDDNPEKFSYLDTTKPLTKQRSCHMTYTSSSCA